MDASLKCKTAELEEPGFDGNSEAGRRWFTTGLKNVPPFSVGEYLNPPRKDAGTMHSRTREDMMMEAEKVIRHCFRSQVDH